MNQRQAAMRRKANRRVSKARLAAERRRVSVRNALELAGHNAIRVGVARCTIGEAYQHARLAECLVTFMGRLPVLVKTDVLERITARPRMMAQATETLYEHLRAIGLDWMVVRPKVRRPKWQPRKRRAR